MNRGVRWILVLASFAALFVVVAMLAAFSGRSGPRVPANSVLWIRLPANLSEEDRRSAFERALGRPALTLRDYVRLLDEAARDRRVRAVVLQVGGSAGGWAMAEELRSALRRFAQTDKDLVSFVEFGGDIDYFLASAADRVVMPPPGTLNVNGLLADVSFYKRTLDKLGVEPNLEHIGAYKNASDVWTRESMSDAHREATNAILDGLFDAFVAGVSESRSLDRPRVLAAVDEAMLSAPRAKELGLVDDLLYEDELLASLREGSGANAARVSAAAYARTLHDTTSREAIGLLYLTGTIVSGSSSEDPFSGGMVGSETIAASLRSLREDRSIRAVVLRVDSPGGSGLASDLIWREVELTRGEKPVIVSMGDVAASGGYYVSMSADAIVAQPTTLTGSIGVISGKFSLRGLYDWAGIQREQIRRGANADLFSDYGAFTQAQRALVRAQMGSFYQDFVRKAAKGRGMTEEAIDALGQGRVWTGRQALERKLVDELGGLDRGIEIAREKAGIAADRSVRIEVYPKSKGLFESFVENDPDEGRVGEWAAALVPASLRSTVSRARLAERLAGEPYLYFEEALAGVTFR
jgi:protease-4